MRGVRVDGHDPLAMYAAARQAIGHARAGEGPTLIEAMTFRFHGHLLGDMDGYMDKDEKAAAIAADPVPRFRAWLIEQGHVSDADLAVIEAEIEAALDDAVEFAINSPFPGLEDLDRDVYAEEMA